MSTTVPGAVEAAVTERVSGLGYDLETLELTAAGSSRVLRVAVDRDGGVDLDAVAEVTRSVSDALDDLDGLGASPYTLEVSSRGTSRPLTLPRHWRRNRDRLVKVVTTENVTVEARITDADDDPAGSVRLREDEGVEHVLDYTSVRRAKIVVELNRKED